MKRKQLNQAYKILRNEWRDRCRTRTTCNLGMLLTTANLSDRQRMLLLLDMDCKFMSEELYNAPICDTKWAVIGEFIEQRVYRYTSIRNKALAWLNDMGSAASYSIHR